MLKLLSDFSRNFADTPFCHQTELAKLKLEKEIMRADNLRLEEELMRRRIELTQAQASNNNDDRPSVSRFIIFLF